MSKVSRMVIGKKLWAYDTKREEDASGEKSTASMTTLLWVPFVRPGEFVGVLKTYGATIFCEKYFDNIIIRLPVFRIFLNQISFTQAGCPMLQVV